LDNHKKTILVVDDEVSVIRILENHLSVIGYDVLTAFTGEEAIIMYKRETISLIILDIMIPKLNGYSICQEVKRESNIPIIILTSLGELSDRITGFELGVDDYMLKPFSLKELETRIKSILKRSSKSFIIRSEGINECLCIGKITIDFIKRHVYKRNEKVRLTGVEFSLLELLISRSGEPFSRSSILEEVWGHCSERSIDTRVVDVHISRLRSKLENDPSNPDLILTARGIGYLFQNVTSILM
jgi:two-component system, OmpR family, response regulator RpaB